MKGSIKRSNENWSDCTFKYFKRDTANMWLMIYSSCRADEVSQDAGEGKGSAWTNHFIAKGNMAPIPGFRFTCKGADGKE